MRGPCTLDSARVCVMAACQQQIVRAVALIVPMKAVLEVKNNSLELQIYPFEACPSVG